GGFGGFGRWGAVAIRMAVAVRVTVAIAVGRSDADRLVGVGEVCRNGLRDVGNRADLHDRLLGLLQNQLLVDSANPGLLFESRLAANAIFLGSRQGNVVLQVTNARRVIGVNDQRVLVRVQVDTLALGIDFVLAVVIVPLRDGRVLVHVFNDVAPADAGVVRA